MRKKVLGLIVAIAAISSGAAFAQNQSTNQNKANAECCQNVKGDKKSKGDKKADRKGNKPQKRSPFDGIQLSADQQQRLQVLRQGLGPVKLNKEQQAQVAKDQNKNLSAEQKQQLKQERKAKKADAKKNYLNGVKEILTPDQYVMFLENVYLYGPGSQQWGKAPGQKMGKKGQAPGAGKAQKGDRKGKKGDKAKKDNAAQS